MDCWWFFRRGIGKESSCTACFRRPNVVEGSGGLLCLSSNLWRVSMYMKARAGDTGSLGAYVFLLSL